MMDTATGSVDYVNMTLDDVIRHMRAKKALETTGVDNSPFLREENGSKGRKRHFQCPNFQRRQRSFNNRNFMNQMARKRLQRAHRTLDLRRKLIAIRANQQGLDLRWKIVANMVATVREQARRRQVTTGHCRPYQHLIGQMINKASASDGRGIHIGRVSQSRINHSCISKIEKLVGKLPPWMMLRTRSAPSVACAASPSSFHSMRSNGLAGGCPQHGEPPSLDHGPPPLAHAAPAPTCLHSYPACSRSYEAAMPSQYYAVPKCLAHHVSPQAYSQGTMNGDVPPPLAFAPQSVGYAFSAPAPFANCTRASNSVSISSSVDEDAIVIMVDNDQGGGQPIQTRRTLNERFTL